VRDLEERVGLAPGTGVRVGEQLVRGRRVVEAVVHPGDHAHRVAESGVGGDVLYAFTVQIDLPAVLEGLDVLIAGHRQ
jgi:hypothetical protein